MSFLRSLFDGEETAPRLSGPKLETAEQESLDLVLESFARFAKDQIDAARIDREHTIEPRLLEELKQLGLFGLIVPEAHGGLSFGATSYARILEEVARASASIAVTIGAHQSIGLKALLRFGSDAQKERWL